MQKKFKPPLHQISLQLAINEFENIWCINDEFDTFVSTLLDKRGDLVDDGKQYSDAEVKNFFIMGLGVRFDKILDHHMEGTLPANWQTTDLHDLAAAATQYLDLQKSKQQLFQKPQPSRQVE